MYEICVTIIHPYSIFHLEKFFVYIFIKIIDNQGITPMMVMELDKKIPEVIDTIDIIIPNKEATRYAPVIDMIFLVNSGTRY